MTNCGPERLEALVSDRRPMGALEHDVLLVLWGMADGGTPADVLDALGQDLAYTTVMTILTRLWQKGLVERERRGRAYLYRPAVSEAELTAHRMYESFTKARDQKEVLHQFIDTLSAREVRTLRALIENHKRGR
jgi:predicted transcriptional regulator